MSEASDAIKAWIDQGEPTTADGTPIKVDAVQRIIDERNLLRAHLSELQRRTDAAEARIDELARRATRIASRVTPRRRAKDRQANGGKR